MPSGADICCFFCSLRFYGSLFSFLPTFFISDIYLFTVLLFPRIRRCGPEAEIGRQARQEIEEDFIAINERFLSRSGRYRQDQDPPCLIRGQIFMKKGEQEKVIYKNNNNDLKK